MPDISKIKVLPVVNIKKGHRTLDAVGCLVKCRLNGKEQLFLKTFSDLIDVDSNALYYGFVKWDGKSCIAPREIKFEIKKRIIESDGITAMYPVKLNKYIMKELIQKAPEQSNTFHVNDKFALNVITSNNEGFEAAVDKVNYKAIIIKHDKIPNGLMRGCPIYDASARVIGLVNNKLLGTIWKVSWATQQNGMHTLLLFCFPSH